MMGNEEFEYRGYDVIQEIGEGGAGKVYKAYHRNLQKFVVIKQLKEIVGNDVQRVEVDILKDLHHPYLPQVFDFFVLNQTAYTVMDYIEGITLKEALERGVTFSEERLLKFARQLCEALAYLHTRQLPVIHGDIKPENIMLTAEDNICLIDFNIAGISRDGKAYTFGCTEEYAAPEQIAEFHRLLSLNKTSIITQSTEIIRHTELIRRDEKYRQNDLRNPGSRQLISEPRLLIPIDKRCDVYSLGATLFHLYTGKTIKNHDRVLDSSTSEGLLYFFNKALSVRPEDRFQDGQEMLKALDNLYKYEKSYRIKRLVRVLTGVFVVLLLLVIGLSINLFVDGKRQQKETLYLDYIQKLEELRGESDSASFETVYTDAIELYPGRLDAYSIKALYYYERFQYEECQQYISEYILDNTDIDSASDFGNIYYLLGDCLIETEDYADAIKELTNSLDYDMTKPEVYVDLTIAYARQNEISQAQETLELAEKIDSEYPGIYLARGELYLAQGDYENAVGYFERCLEVVDDEYMRMRAYVMYSRTLSKLSSSYAGEELDAVYDRNIRLLEQGIKATLITYSPVLLERLAQVEIDAYQNTEDLNYANLAIDTLLRIEKTGTATFSTYDNLLIMYYYAGRFQEELVLLNSLRGKYPDNYVVYMRYAQYELAVQRSKGKKERDYHAFEQYYNKAFELYQNANNTLEGAPEMQALEAAYKDVKKGRWLD